jgi:hypothetical protein
MTPHFRWPALASADASVYRAATAPLLGRLLVHPRAQKYLSSPQERSSAPRREGRWSSRSAHWLWPVAADGVCLRYDGMHDVPHLRGIHASIVVQVVVMGRCARGTFGSREGDGVALRVAGMSIGSCVGASRSKYGFDCSRSGHGLAIGRALAMGQPRPTRTHTHASPDP